MVETGTVLLEALPDAGKQNTVGVHHSDALCFPSWTLYWLEVTMKFKFRRGKPPLKIMERGDRQPLVATVMHLEKIPKPWKPVSITAHCPLCKKPLTKENMHTVYLNRQRRWVHKICPEN